MASFRHDKKLSSICVDAMEFGGDDILTLDLQFQPGCLSAFADDREF
jgi:hypothetical protein